MKTVEQKLVETTLDQVEQGVGYLLHHYEMLIKKYADEGDTYKAQHLSHLVATMQEFDGVLTTLKEEGE